jgi:hypothetical protein
MERQTAKVMHKSLNLTILALLMILFFSAPAINVDWTPVGPNDTLYQLDFSQEDPALADGGAAGGRSVSDSLALFTGGLIMLISASFLRRLSG